MNKEKKLDSLLKENELDSLVIYDDSYSNSNLFYLTNFLAPDEFIYLKKIHKEPKIVISSMESGRAKKQTDLDVVELSELSENHKYYEAVDELFEEQEIRDPGAPFDFPIKFAKELNKYDFEPIDVSSIRKTKSKNEINKIKKAQEVAEKGIKEAEKVLKKSEVKDNKLYLKNEELTSEDIKFVIEKELLKHGAGCEDVIVASGKNSSIPHHSGEGHLDAGPIIIDVFPRLKKERYCGDITRTFSLNKNEEINEIYDVVLSAQEKALNELCSGKKASEIDEVVRDFFRENGYGIERDGDKDTVFLHSTGHGVGLDIHEAPSISKKGDMLEKGDVVTVEPGLYNSELGGVRIEDLVVIEEDGYTNLTSYEKRLMI